MNIYHAHIEPVLVEKLKQEFGEVHDLLLTDKPAMAEWLVGLTSTQGAAFGFEDGASLDNLLIINRNGFYHHLTEFVVGLVSKYKPEFKDNFAYLQIDQHLDLDGYSDFSNFVGRIFNKLEIPVYILVRALNKKNTSRLQPHLPGYDLIKLAKPNSFSGCFSLNKITDYYFCSEIKEGYVYASTDLDAFPSSLFVRRMWHNAREDFILDVYKSLVGEYTKGHKIVGADFTGLDLDGSLSLPQRDCYRTLKKKDDISIKNLIDLTRFMVNISNNSYK